MNIAQGLDAVLAVFPPCTCGSCERRIVCLLPPNAPPPEFHDAPMQVVCQWSGFVQPCKAILYAELRHDWFQDPDEWVLFEPARAVVDYTPTVVPDYLANEIANLGG